jgi:hypothetical protein
MLASCGQVYFVEIASVIWYYSLMARPLRIEFPGAVYHVSSKGNERIQEAVEKYGYTQREVVDHLGIHFTSVYRIMRKRAGC